MNDLNITEYDIWRSVFRGEVEDPLLISWSLGNYLMHSVPDREVPSDQLWEEYKEYLRRNYPEQYEKIIRKGYDNQSLRWCINQEIWNDLKNSSHHLSFLKYYFDDTSTEKAIKLGVDSGREQLISLNKATENAFLNLFHVKLKTLHSKTSTWIDFLEHQCISNFQTDISSFYIFLGLLAEKYPEHHQVIESFRKKNLFEMFPNPRTSNKGIVQTFFPKYNPSKATKDINEAYRAELKRKIKATEKDLSIELPRSAHGRWNAQKFYILGRNFKKAGLLSD